jgi:hydroxyethylthiazole kinase-like uncharacterized protein yjeF
MRGVWRVEQVRAAERALMATLPEGALMQRAAAGLARRAAELLTGARGRVYGSQVVLLVGGGDNGGDALYAGARLAGRGATVTALLATHTGHTSGLAALRAAGGRVVHAGYGEDHRVVTGAHLVVDGMVGIGGHGALRTAYAALAVAAQLARDRGALVLAVDLPSGVEADTGAVPGEAVTADVTVTFGALKAGTVVGAGARRSGLLELVDIGLGPYLPESEVDLLEAGDVCRCWPLPGAGDDKYTRGVVGVAAGSPVYTGAAVLAVGSALRGPAGMVRYAGGALDAVRAAWPEVVAGDSPADAGRVQAWACGPGIGSGAAAEDAVRFVAESDLPAVFDADALTILAEHRDWLAARSERAAPTVLTPHDREFARLSGGEPGPDRIAAAIRLASDLGAVVLLKGDRTVVADSAGEVLINPTGTSWLAAAGTGDVLTGLIGSLLAAGAPAMAATGVAAFLHGLAGRRAADAGPVTAVDVLAALREVTADVLD